MFCFIQVISLLLAAFPTCTQAAQMEHSQWQMLEKPKNQIAGQGLAQSVWEMVQPEPEPENDFGCEKDIDCLPGQECIEKKCTIILAEIDQDLLDKLPFETKIYQVEKGMTPIQKPAEWNENLRIDRETWCQYQILVKPVTWVEFNQKCNNVEDIQNLPDIQNMNLPDQKLYDISDDVNAKFFVRAMTIRFGHALVQIIVSDVTAATRRVWTVGFLDDGTVGFTDPNNQFQRQIFQDLFVVKLFHYYEEETEPIKAAGLSFKNAKDFDEQHKKFSEYTEVRSVGPAIPIERELLKREIIDHFRAKNSGFHFSYVNPFGNNCASFAQKEVLQRIGVEMQYKVTPGEYNILHVNEVEIKEKTNFSKMLKIAESDWEYRQLLDRVNKNEFGYDDTDKQLFRMQISGFRTLLLPQEARDWWNHVGQGLCQQIFPHLSCTWETNQKDIQELYVAQDDASIAKVSPPYFDIAPDLQTDATGSIYTKFPQFYGKTLHNSKVAATVKRIPKHEFKFAVLDATCDNQKIWNREPSQKNSNAKYYHIMDPRFVSMFYRAKIDYFGAGFESSPPESSQHKKLLMEYAFFHQMLKNVLEEKDDTVLIQYEEGEPNYRVIDLKASLTKIEEKNPMIQIQSENLEKKKSEENQMIQIQSEYPEEKKSEENQSETLEEKENAQLQENVQNLFKNL